MVSMGQRIEALRTERNLSRIALSGELGFPKGAIEKYETGRQTPSKEHQEKMAEYFGVSLLYLMGVTHDRIRMSNWMDMAHDDAEPVVNIPAPASKARKGKEPEPEGGLLDTLLATKQARELIAATVLETLRSPEGMELIARAVRAELKKRG